MIIETECLDNFHDSAILHYCTKKKIAERLYRYGTLIGKPGMHGTPMNGQSIWRYGRGLTNKETMAAMLEAERIAHNPGVKHYSDVEEALRELKR